MWADDVEAAAAVSAAAFGVDLRAAEAAQRWRERVAHSMRTDPEGAFVALTGSRLIAIAQAIRRERLWCLSLLAVDPGCQSRHAGGAVLAAALRYEADAPAGLIVSSNDPRALRLYARCGFTLQPTFEAAGMLAPDDLPAADPSIVAGGIEDLAELEPISREVRGGPHTPELRLVLGRGARLIRLEDRGFAVIEAARVWMLVARDEQAAGALLLRGLSLAAELGRDGAGAARGAVPVSVRWIGGRQQWAIRQVVSAGMRLSAYGALCVRGDPGRLWPYLPSPAFA